MLRPVRNCYRFTFHAGPPALSMKAEGTSTGRDSVESYAVTAVPVGPRGGRPGFCMDATGILLFSADGRIREPKQGRCPEELKYWP